MIRHLLIATVVLVATVTGSFAAALPSGTQRSGSVNPSDALLLPADLDVIGLGDYGTGVGVTGGPVALAAFDRAYRGAGTDDRRFASGDAIDRGAALYLLDRSVTERPVRVLSSVVDYTETAAASDAFEAVSAARSYVATETDRDVADDIDVEVDAAATFVVEGVPPYDEAGFRQTSVIAVSGASLVEVAIERQDGSTASVDDVLRLLLVVLTRLAAPGDGASSLAVQVPEITGPTVVPGLSRYVVRAGEAIPQYGQSDVVTATQAEMFSTFQTSDVYQFGYDLSGDGPLVGGFVSRHDGAAAARAYFRAVPDLLFSNDRYDDVRVENAIVRAGDSATLVTYGIMGVDGVVVTEVIVLMGDTVAELIVSAPNAIVTADMTTFALAIEACVSGEGCQPLLIPDDAGFGTDG